MNLLQAVTQPLYYQQHKHDLGEGYVEKQINNMTPMEMLEAISDALESHGVELKEK